MKGEGWWVVGRGSWVVRVVWGWLDCICIEPRYCDLCDLRLLADFRRDVKFYISPFYINFTVK